MMRGLWQNWKGGQLTTENRYSSWTQSQGVRVLLHVSIELREAQKEEYNFLNRKWRQKKGMEVGLCFESAELKGGIEMVNQDLLS